MELVVITSTTYEVVARDVGGLFCYVTCSILTYINTDVSAVTSTSLAGMGVLTGPGGTDKGDESDFFGGHLRVSVCTDAEQNPLDRILILVVHPAKSRRRFSLQA